MPYKCKSNSNNNIDNNITVINTPDKQVNDLANYYIQTYNIDAQQSTGFTAIILYIANNIKVDRNDINKLMYYFDIYITICSQCNILPDMTSYSLFINVPYETVKQWLSGERRNTLNTIYKDTFQKMRDVCKSICVSDAGKGNIGGMYISKAIHGLTDQPQPVNSYTQNNLYVNAPVSREEIAAEFGRQLTDNSK